MKHLKPLILESKNVGNLYHYTSFRSLVSILSSMQLHVSAFYDCDADYYMCHLYKYYISFSRNHMLWKFLSDEQRFNGTIKFETRLKFDGNILSRRYKIKPIDNNWGRDNVKHNYDMSYTIKSLKKKRIDFGDEMEERLYCHETKIDIKKSLLEVMIIAENYTGNTTLNLDNIKKICLENNINLKIYNNINNEILEII